VKPSIPPVRVDEATGMPGNLFALSEEKWGRLPGNVVAGNHNRVA